MATSARTGLDIEQASKTVSVVTASPLAHIAHAESLRPDDFATLDDRNRNAGHAQCRASARAHARFSHATIRREPFLGQRSRRLYAPNRVRCGQTHVGGFVLQERLDVRHDIPGRGTDGGERRERRPANVAGPRASAALSTAGSAAAARDCSRASAPRLASTSSIVLAATTAASTRAGMARYPPSTGRARRSRPSAAARNRMPMHP